MPGMPHGRSWPLPCGMACRRSRVARYRFCCSRSTTAATLVCRGSADPYHVPPSTPRAAS